MALLLTSLGRNSNLYFIDFLEVSGLLSLEMFKNFLIILVGLFSNKEGLDLVKEAIEKAGYTGKIKIGMDVAASEFFTRMLFELYLAVLNVVKCDLKVLSHSKFCPESMVSLSM